MRTVLASYGLFGGVGHRSSLVAVWVAHLRKTKRWFPSSTARWARAGFGRANFVAFGTEAHILA